MFVLVLILRYVIKSNPDKEKLKDDKATSGLIDEHIFASAAIEDA